MNLRTYNKPKINKNEQYIKYTFKGDESEYKFFPYKEEIEYIKFEYKSNTNGFDIRSFMGDYNGNFNMVILEDKWNLLEKMKNEFKRKT